MHELVPLVSPHGEILAGSLQGASDEDLARLASEWEQPRRQAAEMVALVKGELRARMEAADVRKADVAGYEVRLEFASTWDAETLEGVVVQLLDRGAVRSGDITGLIKRDPVVSGTVAKELLDRLPASERPAVEACRSWRVRAVKVTPPLDAEAVEEPQRAIEGGR